MKRFVMQRFLDFRWGYTYLMLPIGIVTTETILYYLLIKEFPLLNSVFPHFIDFVVWGSAGISILAVLVGNLYRRSQLKIDNIAGNEFLLEKIREIVREELDRR